MADEQLKVFVDVVTNRAVSELKKLKKATEDTGEELEDTRTEAQKVADRIDAVTRSMVADMEAAEKAADALAQALGPEMSAKIGQAGIDGFVADMKRAGLTAKDVEADADRLAQTLRNMDQAKRPLKDVDDHMRRIGETTDQSRSVMANFAGNAIAELPIVSGAMGPLNMAIGQFAEYATEGNIKLKNFLQTAGGIGAAAIAFGLIADAVGRSQREAAELEERTRATADAIQSAVDAGMEWAEETVDLSDVTGTLSDALLTASGEGKTLTQVLGELGIEGADAWKLLGRAEQLGLPAVMQELAEASGLAATEAERLVEGVQTYAADSTMIDDELKGIIDNNRLLYDRLAALQEISRSFDLSGIAREFLNTQVAAGGAQADTVAAAEAVAKISREEGPVQVAEAFLKLAGQAQDAAAAEQELEQATADAAAELDSLNQALLDAITNHRKLAQIQWNLERSTLATEDAYADLVTTQSEWGDKVGDDAEELRGLRDATIDVAEQVVDLSLKQLEAKGINADSVEGVQEQITELKRLQEQYPLVKGEIQKYIDELLRIPGTVNTNLTINGRTFGASEVTGPGGTSMTPTNPNATPGGTTIIVNGALDPVAVADQIDRIMSANRYRNGDG